MIAPDALEKQQSTWSAWWERLKKDRGARAELRRCGSVAEVAFCPAFHELRRLRGNPSGERDLSRLGLIAGVLAHVEQDAGSVSFAALLADPKGDKALVSDARFRQLLRADEAQFDERLTELVRVIHQLNRRAPVDRLARDLWWWNDRTRRQWALDYYERAPKPTKSTD